MIDEPRLAWCAGVIDVLGAIRLRKTETGAQLPAVFLSSARQDVLQTLAKMTGTKVTQVFRDYNRLGCGEHCDEAHQHVLSTTGRWSLTGARATVFLSAVEPHILIRKSEVAEAIAAGLTVPHKPATVQKMYELGWPELTA